MVSVLIWSNKTLDNVNRKLSLDYKKLGEMDIIGHVE